MKRNKGDWGILDLPGEECEKIIRERVAEFQRRNGSGLIRGHRHNALPTCNPRAYCARERKVVAR